MTVKALAAIDLLIALLNSAGRISVLIAKAHAESRDLTEEEWAQIVADDDSARASLVEAIAKAKSEGR